MRLAKNLQWGYALLFELNAPILRNMLHMKILNWKRTTEKFFSGLQRWLPLSTTILGRFRSEFTTMTYYIVDMRFCHLAWSSPYNRASAIYKQPSVQCEQVSCDDHSLTNQDRSCIHLIYSLEICDRKGRSTNWLDYF